MIPPGQKAAMICCVTRLGRSIAASTRTTLWERHLAGHSVRQDPASVAPGVHLLQSNLFLDSPTATSSRRGRDAPCDTSPKVLRRSI
jgi:hypothetical protein